VALRGLVLGDDRAVDFVEILQLPWRHGALKLRKLQAGNRRQCNIVPEGQGVVMIRCVGSLLV
jgi:hypothetical protein